MADGVHKKLSSHKQVKAIWVIEVRRLLGGSGAIRAPTEDLERLRGIFQDGYHKSYSFSYQEAVIKLQLVQRGLKKAPDNQARWDLFIKTHIYLGKSFMGMKKNDVAMDAFKVILRTRPEMKLSRKDHPEKDIQLWEKARVQVKKAKKGKLVVDTEPSGAIVFLDGAMVGVTPFIGSFPLSCYHMRLQHKGTGLSHARNVGVWEEMTRLRIDLAFESSLLPDLSHPSIKLPEGQIEVPTKWWPWIGERLEVGQIAVVEKGREEEKTYWSASLVDLGDGRLVRKVRLEEGGDIVGELARFIATGEVSDKALVAETKSEPSGDDVEPKESVLDPSVELKIASTRTARPWYRKWWPYAVGGAVLLGGGVAANLVANDYYSDTGGLSSKQDAADTWMGVAIGGYVLAGVSIIMGIVLDVTWDDEGSSHRLVPVAGQGEVGMMWVYRF
jgi:hypothetical protein